MTSICCALCQNIVRTFVPGRSALTLDANLYSRVDEWKSFDGDVVARSYWMCILLEG